jgi:hypothetical protein
MFAVVAAAIAHDGRRPSISVTADLESGQRTISTAS